MSNFLDSLERGIKQAYCQGLLENPRFASNAGGLTDLPGLRDYFDAVNALICDRPPAPLPYLLPPFSGGQCFTTYSVVFQYTDQFGQRQTNNQQITGRVLGPYQVDTGGETFQTGIERQQTPNGPVSRTLIATVFRPGGVDPAITSVTRVDGQLDDCGDPAIDPLPEPGPITVNVDVTYGPNNEFSLTVPVIFGVAYISLDGSISIPVDVGGINLTGNLNFDGDFDFSLDIPINIGGGDSPGPNLPGDPSVDPGPGDEPDPSDRVIVGVFVRAPSISSNLPTLLPQNGAPTVLAPRVGTVKFLVRGGERSGWTPDVPVKSARAYIPCPAPQGAVAVAVTGDYGTELDWTPLYNRPPRDQGLTP